MCVCTHVYMYVASMYTVYTCTCMCFCVCICIVYLCCMCAFLCVYVCACVCICVCICVYVYVCVGAQMHILKCCLHFTVPETIFSTIVSTIPPSTIAPTRTLVSNSGKTGSILICKFAITTKMKILVLCTVLYVLPGAALMVCAMITGVACLCVHCRKKLKGKCTHKHGCDYANIRSSCRKSII